MGTGHVTQRKEPKTIPVVRPDVYSDRIVWMPTYIAGVLNVSNMIGVIFSRFAFGFVGASVSRTGCSSGATHSSLENVWC